MSPDRIVKGLRALAQASSQGAGHGVEAASPSLLLEAADLIEALRSEKEKP